MRIDQLQERLTRFACGADAQMSLSREEAGALARRIARLEGGIEWMAECVISERSGTPDPHGWIARGFDMADARQAELELAKSDAAALKASVAHAIHCATSDAATPGMRFADTLNALGHDADPFGAYDKLFAAEYASRNGLGLDNFAGELRVLRTVVSEVHEIAEAENLPEAVKAQLRAVVERRVRPYESLLPYAAKYPEFEQEIHDASQILSDIIGSNSNGSFRQLADEVRAHVANANATAPSAPAAPVSARAFTRTVTSEDVDSWAARAGFDITASSSYFAQHVHALVRIVLSEATELCRPLLEQVRLRRYNLLAGWNDENAERTPARMVESSTGAYVRFHDIRKMSIPLEIADPLDSWSFAQALAINELVPALKQARMYVGSYLDSSTAPICVRLDDLVSRLSQIAPPASAKACL